MNDPRKTKAPVPVGAREKTQPTVSERGDREQTCAYREMELMDERAIVAANTGQTFAHMIYDIPFKSKYGSQTCHKGKDCIRAGTPHTHVVGIGVMGVDEIVRLMGGIKIQVSEARVITRNGRQYYQATAIAQDYFTMTVREGTAEAKIGGMRRGGDDDDPRGDFEPIIAQRKAERNAAKKIVPQGILNGIAALAKEGKTTFSEEDVRRLFVPFYTERQLFIQRWFDTFAGRSVPAILKDLPSHGEIGTGAILMPPPSEAFRRDAPSPSAPQNTQKFLMSEQQKRYIYKLMTDADLNRDQIAAYMKHEIARWESQGLNQKEEASALIEAFKNGDFSSFNNWDAMCSELPSKEVDQKPIDEERGGEKEV